MAATPSAISAMVLSSPLELLVPIMTTATLGRRPLQVAVVEPPQDMGPVAADPQIDGMTRRIGAVPDFLSLTFPALGDGVPDEHHFGTGAGRIDDGVHRVPALLPAIVRSRDGFSGGVGLGRS